ncbi:heterogeneous nuclear ribonucleoprotein A0-like [Macrobrachium rosenbergii]|uniref:heterogeneous nuclear ribonucleoprotein A0-like n=1 Tax=Macrobrachium rosenbergii TaxID=79674 RepID=UPI0034D649CF
MRFTERRQIILLEELIMVFIGGGRGEVKARVGEENGQDGGGWRVEGEVKGSGGGENGEETGGGVEGRGEVKAKRVGEEKGQDGGGQRGGEEVGEENGQEGWEGRGEKRMDRMMVEGRGGGEGQ